MGLKGHFLILIMFSILTKFQGLYKKLTPKNVRQFGLLIWKGVCYIGKCVILSECWHCIHRQKKTSYVYLAPEHVFDIKCLIFWTKLVSYMFWGHNLICRTVKCVWGSGTWTCFEFLWAFITCFAFHICSGVKCI